MPDANGRFRGISVPPLPWLKAVPMKPRDIKGDIQVSLEDDLNECADVRRLRKELGLEDDLERLAKESSKHEQSS